MMDAEQLKALRHIASVCIAPAPAALIPVGEQRAQLERSLERYEAVRAPELAELEVEFLDAQILGLRHRLDTGCRCRQAAAEVLAHDLQAAGAIPKLPDRAS